MKRGWLVIGIFLVVIVILSTLSIYLFSNKKINEEVNSTKENPSINNKEKTCADKGKMCGGIAGIKCCDNLMCDYGDNYAMPDASGICKTCEELNGIWRTGLPGFPEDFTYCSISYSDENKPCSDGSECKSKYCLADNLLSREQKDDLDKLRVEYIYSNGTCYGNNFIVGCRYFVYNSKAEGATCIS
ncbi:hypothetical protein HYW74_00305 [Candidatus Pacearchaeota archaeon]|nr:hypothetical protein [Candidatus Pacearchaeota archaeon]